MNKILIALCAVLVVSANAFAGPENKSKFRDAPYAPQKTVYDFSHQKPGDSLAALGYLRNQIRALKEFGGYEGSHLVVVSHGNGLHAFARENRDMFPEAYAKLKEFTDQGVSFYVCRNAARARGYKSEDFYDLVTVIPAGVTELAKWQSEGYTYMHAGFSNRLTREDLMKTRESKKD